jgi:hypothetical protein
MIQNFPVIALVVSIVIFRPYDWWLLLRRILSAFLYLLSVSEITNLIVTNMNNIIFFSVGMKNLYNCAYFVRSFCFRRAIHRPWRTMRTRRQSSPRHTGAATVPLTRGSSSNIRMTYCRPVTIASISATSRSHPPAAHAVDRQPINQFPTFSSRTEALVRFGIRDDLAARVGILFGWWIPCFLIGVIVTWWSKWLSSILCENPEQSINMKARLCKLVNILQIGGSDVSKHEAKDGEVVFFLLHDYNMESDSWFQYCQSLSWNQIGLDDSRDLVKILAK